MIRDVKALPANVDLAVIGAGPADLAASTTAARLELSVSRAAAERRPRSRRQVWCRTAVS
jgi:flavin-dependent dehydrogenase